MTVGRAQLRTWIALVKAGDRTLAGVLGDCNKDCGWIYRFGANPGKPKSGIVPLLPVLAPGTALGSRPRVALSSAQAPSAYCEPRPSGNSRLNHILANRGTKSSWLREPSQGSVIRANALRWVATRSRVRPVLWLCYNIIVHLEKEDCPRLDRGNLRPPICPATFRTETFATREGSPTEVSRGMDRGDR